MSLLLLSLPTSSSRKHGQVIVPATPRLGAPRESELEGWKIGRGKVCWFLEF